jgi:hypothetical protein
VKDPRHLEAVILRYREGWPFESGDPNVPDLVRHFKKSRKQIQRWISEALEVMRSVFGDKK